MVFVFDALRTFWSHLIECVLTPPHFLTGCVYIRSGVPAESEPGAGGDVSAESSQSLPTFNHQHVCCHHKVHMPPISIDLPVILNALDYFPGTFQELNDYYTC